MKPVLPQHVRAYTQNLKSLASSSFPSFTVVLPAMESWAVAWEQDYNTNAALNVILLADDTVKKRSPSKFVAGHAFHL